MRKKILVCGSAGFLMSNFMRYILYRSKDFEIVSVDILTELEDYKRVYLNRSHRFYIGDVTDKSFMEKLMYVEKPNWIINGVGLLSSQKSRRQHLDTVTKSAMVLSEFNIPIIQPMSHPEYDPYKSNFFSSQFVSLTKGVPLILPECFGLRQKSNTGLAKIIKSALSNEKIYIDNVSAKAWAYAEDVASLIWYIIENDIHKEIKMPPLGFLTVEEITLDIIKILGSSSQISRMSDYSVSDKEGLWNLEIRNYPIEDRKLVVEGWLPDSKNLETVLKKTVLWYKTNKWAIK